MKKVKKKVLIFTGAIAGLLTVLIILGTCGGGKLTVAHNVPTVNRLIDEMKQEEYSARIGLRVGPVTVVADTPWGILIRCHITKYHLAQWYVLEDPKDFEVTSNPPGGKCKAETRWFFFRPGESFKIYLDDRRLTEDGTFWTFTNGDPNED